jgi:ABC-type lipoprotein release transport system permease subunit
MLLNGLRPTAMGLCIGLFAGITTAKLISNVLFGVRPFEAVLFAAVTFLVLLISLGACTYPAGRAARIAPLGALR